METKKSKIYLTIISVSIYLFSLTQTAISSNALEDKTLSGLATLFIGGTVILGGGLLEWLIWLANPLYFLGIYHFFRQNKKAKLFSISASIIALSFSTWNEILVSESGRMGKIDNLNIGYWLWVLSLSIMAIGIFYLSFKEIKIEKKHYA